ncbi:cytochrome c biogenesis protein [Calothrix sp. PCC 6303]|uniref:cytochrome c biogenesis protein n=1 Tax=Calothrix sp. PCC 6303 TaxID=1170562 RepID=UPI0002A032FB|nr:cytochrome c biogenesis protein ResB [Calothrix sp. PCC 6303]AFZ03422.1 Cytochrome c biogenesis protein ccs1 [Calothrix sp. PCC 6303]
MTIDNSTEKELNWLSLITRSLKQDFLPVLTDLRLAIILLLVIAVFSISGTVIEQGQSAAFYQANYPESPALFGFLTWKVIQIIGLNEVYRTWWFLALLILFGTSLTACTFTRQLPALKAAQKWKFYNKSRQFQKLALSAEFNEDNLSPNSLQTLNQILQKRSYKVFQDENNTLYARKGIIGKIGPIIVHIGIVVTLLGSIWGAMTGFMAQEMVPSGESFQVKNIIDAGPFAAKQVPQDWSVKVNRFWIDYTATGGIDQFYSDMSVINSQGQEVDRQTIFVNQPLRYHGITFYQTDWGISSANVRVNNSPIFQLPMAPLETNGKGKLWGTWIPTKPDLSEGVSLLAKDLQGTVFIYDSKGQLVDTVRTGMSTKVNGVTLKILDVVGSTGLQIKSDPGIPLVYTGFACLMAGLVMSYFSHSQVWALQANNRLYVGGKTNRAQVAFEREILEVLDSLNVANHDNPGVAESLPSNI